MWICRISRLAQCNKIKDIALYVFLSFVVDLFMKPLYPEQLIMAGIAQMVRAQVCGT